MKNQTLSIEQMQKLKELGVDTSKASMFYVPKLGAKGEYVLLNVEPVSIIPFIPTFNIQDILEMLPSVIDDKVDTYRLSISKLGNGDWFVSMFNNGNSKYLFGDWISDKSLLIAAYEMLVMIAENGYLKGGEHE